MHSQVSPENGAGKCFAGMTVGNFCRPAADVVSSVLGSTAAVSDRRPDRRMPAPVSGILTCDPLRALLRSAHWRLPCHDGCQA
ncbi:hypothetical protein CO2235_160003 [Cupriavidus oxalaticus]|uniref:Uncharacterized protein n=1 Tax=Cupriavidus oxalaticus TaxID=96344 RepID=A0A375FT93_9BURK|nr:hypothetical protein CO2235_U670041 [Cupriavidus oxalaticus]SPC12798.1 hypothetical protein CO2235_160003 [Cupriavidus oxalaticus]